MSILKDRIRPLDPTSLQKFLGHAPEGEGDGGGAEPFATQPTTPDGTTAPKLAPRSRHDTGMADQSCSEHDVEGLGTAT